MGRARTDCEAVVVDGHDAAVPDGTPGELILRPRAPFCFATGYFEMPDQTVQAWRNLWFHTGDRVVRDRFLQGAHTSDQIYGDAHQCSASFRPADEPSMIGRR